MKFIILAADYGVKLDNAQECVPKALLPIRNIPMIEHLANKIQFIGAVRDISIVVKSCFLKEFREWRDSRSFVVPVKLVDDGSLNGRDGLGAVKDLALVIEKELVNDDVVVVGADNLFSFGLSPFIDYGRIVRPNPTIGIYNYAGGQRAKKYGIVYRDAEGRVIDFCEKPSRLNGSRFVSLCIYYFPKETLKFVSSYIDGGGDSFSMGKYISWLMRRYAIYTYEFQGDWLDVGDVDSYTEAVCTF
jgi:glucose-1-phosphate thymidylyltransferase